MKKGIFAVALCLLFCGCAAKDYETMSDEYLPQTQPQAAQTQIALPPDASVQSVNADGGKIWFCDGYEITLQTIASADLAETLKDMTGFEMDTLNPVQTKREGITKIQCAWSAAGESGEQVCRGVILDDGNYHYCLCLSAPVESAASLQDSWQDIVDSFSLH